jgi:hypothetical protein
LLPVELFWTSEWSALFKEALCISFQGCLFRPKNFWCPERFLSKSVDIGMNGKYLWNALPRLPYVLLQRPVLL